MLVAISPPPINSLGLPGPETFLIIEDLSFENTSELGELKFIYIEKIT